MRPCSEDYLAGDFFGHIDFSFAVESPPIMGSLLEPKSAVAPKVRVPLAVKTRRSLGVASPEVVEPSRAYPTAIARRWAVVSALRVRRNLERLQSEVVPLVSKALQGSVWRSASDPRCFASGLASIGEFPA